MNEKELRKSAVGKSLLSNVLLALKIIFDLIPQLLVVYLIGRFNSEKTDIKIIKIIFSGIFLSFLLKGIFYFFSVKTAHDNAYSKLTDLRVQIIEHLKKLNLGFFKEHSTGELTNIIEHDVEQAEVYLAHGLPEIMSASFLPVIVFIAMLFVDFRLALVMTAGVPLMFLVMTLSKKAMNKNLKAYFEHENKMRKEMMEYVKNIAVIKAFSKEEDFSRKTLETAKSYVQCVKKNMSSINIPMGLIDVFMESGVVFVMILGSILLIQNKITVVQFILSIILSSAFISAISKTATLHHFSFLFKEAVSGIGKILSAEINNKKQNKKLNSGCIKFENVSFKYEKDGFEIKDINLFLEKNTFNAFAGSSGSGKSTLAHLLMGFWDADKGKIFIGNEDISKYKQENISDLIGCVEQEIILFNLSIYDNIAAGKEGVSKEEIIEAAKKAQCHDFICALPCGYETKVGEMGVKLSGGEKQRIAIARTILKNAPILIFDEAAASLDSENERLILRTIKELCKDRTVITIAHNLNSVRNADKIIFMDKGRILDTGTHEQLMNRCDFYSRMVQAQNKVDDWDIRNFI